MIMGSLHVLNAPIFVKNVKTILIVKSAQIPKFLVELMISYYNVLAILKINSMKEMNKFVENAIIGAKLVIYHTIIALSVIQNFSEFMFKYTSSNVYVIQVIMKIKRVNFVNNATLAVLIVLALNMINVWNVITKQEDFSKINVYAMIL